MAITYATCGSIKTTRVNKIIFAKTEREGTYMGPLDQFKDFFRGIFRGEDNKKITQLKKLFIQINLGSTEITPQEKFNNFVKIASLADESSQSKFTIAENINSYFNNKTFEFKIDGIIICKIDSNDDINELINKYTFSQNESFMLKNSPNMNEVKTNDKIINPNLLQIVKSVFDKSNNSTKLINIYKNNNGEHPFNLEDMIKNNDLKKDVKRIDDFDQNTIMLIKNSYDRFINVNVNVTNSDLLNIFATFQSLFIHHLGAQSEILPHSEDISGIQTAFIVNSNQINREKKIHLITEKEDMITITTTYLKTRVSNGYADEDPEKIIVKLEINDTFKLTRPEQKLITFCLIDSEISLIL